MNGSIQKKAQMSMNIFPKEAWELFSKNKKSKDLIIIDVSTPKEYENLHLEGAININLLSRFFIPRLDILNKDCIYVVYCKVGGRSRVAKKLMQQSGFKTVYNIVGGILLWEEEGLPFDHGGNGVSNFSFCPIFMSIVSYKKLKKILIKVLSLFFQPKGAAGTSA